MPELPEVEIVKRGLKELIVGKMIQKLDILTDKSFLVSQEDIQQFLIGAQITAVKRRAKLLLIDLSSGYSLAIHLKMTGQLIVDNPADRFGAGHPNDSFLGTLPDRSTRVEFWLSENTKLYFNDQRKFGWIKLLPTAEVPDLPFMQKVGPEPLKKSFTVDDFLERFERRSRSMIKAALLDQSVIAGVGNIYADESLWGAEIHPASLVGLVPLEKMKKLYQEVRFVMNLSIEKGGSTSRNYLNAKGERGSYLSFARVFRREGQSCPRCQQEIIKIRVAGRGTHICPVCQIKTK